MSARAERLPGVLTPGLCIVADSMTVSEAYAIAHDSPVENIKVRPESYLNGSADDVEQLRRGDFHVLCDAKIEVSRADEAVAFFRLFRRGGIAPDAVSYSRASDPRALSEIVGLMDDGALPNHTMVMTATLPERRITTQQRMPHIREALRRAVRLQQLGAKVGVYACASDFNKLDVAEGVLRIGAGIRDQADELWGYTTLEESRDSVDIPLLGTVMGGARSEKEVYLKLHAPKS